MASVHHFATGEFYGTIVRRHVSNGATLSIVRHANSRELPVHSHEQPYFCLLVEGKYAETYDGSTITYDPFSIALHPAAYSHADSISSLGATFFTIELGDEWHERLRDIVDLHNVRVRLAGADVGRSALRLLREFLETEDPNELLVESLLYDMLGAFAQPEREPGRPAWFDTAKAFLEERLVENHSMRDIAAVANVHPVSLARAFRALEHQTVGEYVNRGRVARACKELGTANARIADIATGLGYVDQSHFTRVFKNVTGMTPGVFRSVVLQSRPVVET